MVYTTGPFTLANISKVGLPVVRLPYTYTLSIVLNKNPTLDIHPCARYCTLKHRESLKEPQHDPWYVLVTSEVLSVLAVSFWDGA
jgi:hypothetical protein